MDGTGLDRSFGHWLKQVRRTRGLEQAALAKELDYSPELLRKYESGRRPPSKGFIDALADWLRIGPERRGEFRGFALGALPADARGRCSVPEWLSELALHRTLSPPPTNLPLPPSPLIGRQAEAARILANLRGGSTCPPIRLLTLVGPGGVGKTRLALEVAAALREDFAAGVWFVDLAPIADPRLVIPTVADALGVREAAGQPLLDAVRDRLRPRPVLLVLDNFEQVLAAAAEVGALLAACARLTVLATSRERLRLRWEHLHVVPSLALPDPKQLPPLHALAGTAAVALFVERARAAAGSSILCEANAHAVAELCHRLDGLPLALELAAARTNHLAPDELLHGWGGRSRG